MDNHRDHTAHVAIKKMADDDKPREKLLIKGAEVLSNAELLAILIKTGTLNRSAIDVARDILRLAKDNLQQLGRLTVKEFQTIKGMGKAKAITIVAALELGRRRHLSKGLQHGTITTSAEAADIFIPLLNDLHFEAFYALYLNHSNKFLDYKRISSGGLTGTVVDIRLIMKYALEIQASQLILAHNHPSGNLKPSRADRELTQKIKEAAIIMDMKLLDHLIVADGKYFSMMDEGAI